MDRFTTRREMLRLLAAGIGGSALLPALAAAQRRDASDDDPQFVSEGSALPRINRIGLQLYTVRTVMGKDIEGTIAAVAAAGVTELEFAGYYNKPAEWWGDLMKKHHLTAPSTHIGFPKTDAEWAPQFDMAKAMGHQWVIVPSVGREYRGADGFKRLADRLNASGELAKKAGLRIGYHNHDFEFAKLDSGMTGLETLLTNTDPSLVDFELDIYWAVFGGDDPLALMKKYPKRFACCHVKDAGPAPEHAMLDVGAGTIDFKSIIAQGRKGALQHWFIEHDQPKDAIASVNASAAALKKL